MHIHSSYHASFFSTWTIPWLALSVGPKLPIATRLSVSFGPNLRNWMQKGSKRCKWCELQSFALGRSRPMRATLHHLNKLASRSQHAEGSCRVFSKTFNGLMLQNHLEINWTELNQCNVLQCMHSSDTDMMWTAVTCGSFHDALLYLFCTFVHVSILCAQTEKSAMLCACSKGPVSMSQRISDWHQVF